ncbi:hypothetical protein BOTBODRAFT_28921 [Botryobasidium botryosum FD-172 SS1]|uniref:DUF4470 domain-containing protein n=1 Tax=Botryobasidium botryosum (strain FD-172 SS1) TaxID=930990 RepID=A0A067MSF2_BOTB1|nr:hypothetical protein BOTBODRAFT_28921 [Botryobasidium botryosum FD-172 SS1]
MAPPTKSQLEAKEKADVLKAKGNEKYKTLEYDEAIKLYKAAATLQPTEPVYLSNLSAAQLEAGKYADAFDSCNKGLSLISTADSSGATLRAKLLVRRAKLALLLHADDPTYLDQAKIACEELENGELQKAALHRARIAHGTKDLANIRVSSLPRYRQPMRRLLEHFGVGHDEPNSIFRVQRDDSEKSTKGRPHSYEKQFHMRIPRDGKPFDFSAIFVGVGDARHLYVSLADVGVDLKSLGNKSSAQKVKVHFCLIDIHPATLAKDLLVLTTLDELSKIPSTARPKNSRAKDLLLMLHYVYWGTTMPPAANAILEEQLNALYESVKQVVEKGEALERDWLYVDAKTVESLIPKLKFWIEKGKTTTTFQKILPDKIDSDPGLPPMFMPAAEGNPLSASEILARRHQHGLDAIAHLRTSAYEDPEARAVFTQQAKERGESLDAYIDSISKVTPEQLARVENAPNSLVERQSFDILRVMVPPAHAKEPKALETVFKTIRGGQSIPSHEILEATHQAISKRWIPNYTLLDEHWEIMTPMQFCHCPFQGVRRMLPDYLGYECPAELQDCIYHFSEVFFGLVADGMERLRARKSGGLKIEVRHADGYAALDGIRMRTLSRNEAFPVLFDRIHASNVPDYVGGYLANFTSAIPLLKAQPSAYFTSCSLLNANVWEGKFMEEFAKSLDSALWTYAGVTLPEVPAAYGAQLSCTPSFPGSYHTFRRLEQPPTRLSRSQLTALLYAVFIRTVLPARYKRYGAAAAVREVQNVQAFFRLLETLKRLGYQSHVLAEVVESILENRVTNGFAPHDAAPIPLSARQNPPCVVCTVPFMAEFEVSAAVWEPRLFPICSATLPALDSIVRYSVKMEFGMDPINHKLPPTHFVLALAFGLPKDLDEGVLDPRKRIVGTRNCGTSLQIVSTFDFNPDKGVVTFLLAQSRAEGFIKAGYEVAMIHTAFWRVHSWKAKCSEMEVVGDVDRWDKDVALRQPKHRELSKKEERDFMEVMMRSDLTRSGGMGGFPGLGGFPGFPGMPEMPGMGGAGGSPSMDEFNSMMQMLSSMMGGIPGMLG